jgi:hypothetical protein
MEEKSRENIDAILKERDEQHEEELRQLEQKQAECLENQTNSYFGEAQRISDQQQDVTVIFANKGVRYFTML